MTSQILIAALTLIFGIAALWMAARLRRDARKCRNWQTVPAKILERGVESMQTDARSFTPRIKYAYTVAGKEYIGQQVYRTGRVGRLKKAATKMVDALPDPIPVHYNPEDPNEAYLLADPAIYFWISLIFGICAILWGLLTVLTLLVG